MWEELLKAIPVYLASMLKFILGPVGGYTTGLNLLTTILATVFGMMTVVVVFTYSGNWFREKVLSRFLKKKNKFSDSNRRFATIWKKYGLPGVALLTPLLLTPIGGTLLAISSGSPKEKIIFYMFLSAAFWAVLFTFAIYFFGNEVIPDIIRPDPLPLP
jgi:membrane protein DedA with SNARE-associated domain